MSPKEEFKEFFHQFLSWNHCQYEVDNIGTLIYKNNILHITLNGHIYAGMPAGLIKSLPLNSNAFNGHTTDHPSYNLVWYYIHQTSRLCFWSNTEEITHADYLPVFPIPTDPIPNVPPNTGSASGSSLHIVKRHQTTWGPSQPVLTIDDIAPSPYYIQDQDVSLKSPPYVKNPATISSIISKFGKQWNKV